MTGEDERVVEAFNDAINAGDLAALTRLMSEDHRFVDAVGGSVDGKTAGSEAWRGFFAAYPDYRNHFEEVRGVGGGVEVIGESTCAEPALGGRPAGGPSCVTAWSRSGASKRDRVGVDLIPHRGMVACGGSRCSTTTTMM